MANVRTIVVAAAALVGVAAPAAAQDTRGYSSFVYPMQAAPGDVQGVDDRLADLRRTVARRTARDGGTLSARDRREMDRRLSRIIAEERIRRHLPATVTG